jgi:uncharacterized protein (TIGR00255 family)
MEISAEIPVEASTEVPMVRSMTGFGRSEVDAASRRLTVEVRSVNHRYLDVTIKLPKKLHFLEGAVRNELKPVISRGKVDVFVSCEEYAQKDHSIQYHRELAAQYMAYLRQMAEDFGLENDVSVSCLSGFPEVFTAQEPDPDEEELWRDLSGAVRRASEECLKARIAEGKNLKADLLGKLSGMEKQVESIEAYVPRVSEEYHRRLREKVKELLKDAQIEESRLLTEVAVFADKVCVDEELVRLRSHIEAARRALAEGGGIGRKLDFLAQEMNREANTILSKAGSLEIVNRAIELKTEIEKIREQIQNIE